MLNRLSTLFLFLSMLTAIHSGTCQNLMISISNIQSVKGNILIAVYDISQQFPGDDTFAWAIEPVTQTGSMTVSINNIPFGKYAVSVFHDENSNEILDSNFLKIPKEPYGFSNNARGRFGPPDFEDALIDFKDIQQVFEIDLK